MGQVPGWSPGSETFEGLCQGQGAKERTEEWDGISQVVKSSLVFLLPLPRVQGLLFCPRGVGIDLEGISTVVGMSVAVRIVVLNFVECFPASGSVLRTSLECPIGSSQQPRRVGVTFPVLQRRNHRLSGHVSASRSSTWWS